MKYEKELYEQILEWPSKKEFSENDRVAIMCISTSVSDNESYLEGRVYTGADGFDKSIFELICTEQQYHANKNIANELPKHVYPVLLSGKVVGYTDKVNHIKNIAGLHFTKWLHLEAVPDNAYLEELTGITAEAAGISSEPKIDKGEKYRVTIRDRRTGETIRVDIYDVLEAFSITCSSMAHAIKKFLMAGKRGVKGFDKDCDEGINSVEQSKLLQKYRSK